MLSQFVQAVLVGAVSVWGNRKERRSYVATTRRGGPGGAPGPRTRANGNNPNGDEGKAHRPAVSPRRAAGSGSAILVEPRDEERERERFKRKALKTKQTRRPGKNNRRRCSIAYFSFVFACVGLVDADSGGRHELRDHTPRAYASDALVERFRCFVPWVIAKKEDG